ncbi:MAG TPA: biotin/lipoyl-binding protein [Bacillus bacterium]|nr:biotin/lipoyl-binding protein [Bacillus sp. (in: firmicutes)]
MKNLRVIVFLVMSILIAGGATLIYTSQASGGNSPVNKPTAYIEATNVNASFKIAGRITEVLVDEGDHVKKGQVLARLESKELENKVAQAEAAILLADGKIAEASGAKMAAAAKEQQGSEAVTITEQSIASQIEQAEAGIKAAEANVQAVNAKVNAAKELYDIATTNYERATALLAAGATAQVQVDEAKAKMEQAKAEYLASKEQEKAAIAQVEQAKATMNNAIANRGKVGVSKKDVEVASASVSQAEGAIQSAKGGKNQAEAALAEAKTYLGYTELVAPSDGVIVTKSAEMGELVNSGFPIFTIETNGPKTAHFYLDETEVVDLNKGDKVIVELVAAKQKIEGIIKMVSPAGDFAVKKATQNIGDTDVRSFAIKVELPNLPSGVQTGMTVKLLGKGEAK